MHKLGVVVPYRDREMQLQTFLSKVPKYLKRQNIDYEIIVVEQVNRGDFNRGALLNIGAKYAEGLGCDYLVFHDVDLLPLDVDYSYPEHGPVELVKKIKDKYSSDKHFTYYLQSPEYDYFGGVTLFTLEDFKRINGYSNRYVGWGFEDNDLLARCEEVGLELTTKPYRHLQVTTAGICFNGKNAYGEVSNLGRFTGKESYLVNFQVLSLPFVENEISDEATIFSVPGLDFNISYTNFGTLKFEVFDDYEVPYAIHTERIPLRIMSQAVVVFSEDSFTCYFNGKKVGSCKVEPGHRFKLYSNKIYFGVANPSRGSKAHWMNGYITDFAVFARPLETSEIRTIFEEGSILGLGKFKPKRWYSAYTCIDGEVRDVIGGGESLYTSNCTVETVSSPYSTYRVLVPKQRKGLFESQPHKSNGLKNGSWRHWSTRLNQKKYLETLEIGSRKDIDGLSTLDRVVKRIQVESPENGVTHIRAFFTTKV